jgi:hypothetical protein
MDELMRVLEGTLSPDGATRGAAEQRLTELQRTPGAARPCDAGFFD